MDEGLEGKIVGVVYNNEETGYAVLRVETAPETVSTVVGCLPFSAPGEWLRLTGKWGVHPQHGNQFVAASAVRALPQTPDDMELYLGSGIIRGVGKATAALLVARFGVKSLGVLEHTPERLVEVRGITAKRAKQIGEAFSRQVGLRLLMELLVSYKIPAHVAIKLLGRYGAPAIRVVRDNPYVLVDEFFGVDFFPADAMALDNGMSPEEGVRCQAALTYELRFNLDVGHVCLPREKLVLAASDLIELEGQALDEALDKLILEGGIFESPDGDCYLAHVYAAESALVDYVAEKRAAIRAPAAHLHEQMEALEREYSITYAAAQCRAVELAAGSGFLLLTGGPGTGKTTTVRAMLAVFERMRLKPALAAPTGRAAKRLSELTGLEAKTLHRLLEFGFDPDSSVMRFMRDENNLLEADVVVVDEASMIDILLMAALLRALPSQAILVLVGDPDQLPPVGPGNVLGDLLESGAVDSVVLTEIFRQARQSRIVMGAHQINHGDVPELKNGDGDLFFLRRRGAEEAVATILGLVAKRLPEGLGVDASQIQVLSPTRRGACGTVSLNRALQQALNPPAHGKLERAFGDILFREGDRVMHIRNNYDRVWRSAGGELSGRGVFNGEIGLISAIDGKAELLTVQYDERFVDYPFAELSELEPAFAMTVHKSQGSEYTAVVLSVMPGPEPLMTRQVLYTAMTRARDWLVLVGEESVVRQMTLNARRKKRYGNLKKRIMGYELS